MVIGLFTSRVVLNALGQDDFGIYGAVGGFVTMFSIVTGALTNAISRFLAFELGKTDGRFQAVFSMTVLVQLILALIVILFAEPLGYWYLNYKMNIPPDRLGAANWVLQCAILTFAVNLMSVPYNASIVAHEKMEAFAYIGLVEGLLNLGVAINLQLSGFDKLKVYAILMLSVGIIIRIIYGRYARRHIPGSKCTWVLDKGLLKEIFSYAGWTTLGGVSNVFSTEGINQLINHFFGVRVNAARSVAVKVESTVSRFVRDFLTAINPQITKSYAAGKQEYMHELIFKGTKYSYFLMFFFSLPISLETDMILRLWLGRQQLPDYSVIFVRLSLLAALFQSLGNSLALAVNATGNIKRYQIVMSSIAILIFPLSWLAYRLGFPPQASYYIYACVFFVLVFVRLYLVKGLIGMEARMFFKEILIKVGVVSLAASIGPCLLYYLQMPSMGRLIEVVFASILSTAIAVYFLGMTAGERVVFKLYLVKIFKHGTKD